MPDTIYTSASRPKIPRNRYGYTGQEGSGGNTYLSDITGGQYGEATGSGGGGGGKIYYPFIGATETEDGQEGLVPQPLAESQDSFLVGDGTWKDFRMKTDVENEKLIVYPNYLDVSSIQVDVSAGRIDVSTQSGLNIWGPSNLNSTLNVHANSNNQNIYPFLNNTYDLGSQSLKWDKSWIRRGIFNEVEASAGTFDNIHTSNLTVTGQAHFFELVIDRIKSAGGSLIISPADGFILYAWETKSYWDDQNTSPGDYVNYSLLRLYFLAKDKDGQAVRNMWEPGDQALVQDFNRAQVGVSYDVANAYFWTVVRRVSSAPVCINYTTDDIGNRDISMLPRWDDPSTYCHYIEVEYTPSANPNFVGDPSSLYPGANVVMLGHRKQSSETNEQALSRQSAIYISAYDVDSGAYDPNLRAPFYIQYRGINDFTLHSHRYSWWSSGVRSGDLPANRMRGDFVLTSGDSIEDYVQSQIPDIMELPEIYEVKISQPQVFVQCDPSGNALVDSSIHLDVELFLNGREADFVGWPTYVNDDPEEYELLNPYVLIRDNDVSTHTGSVTINGQTIQTHHKYEIVVHPDYFDSWTGLSDRLLTFQYGVLPEGSSTIQYKRTSVRFSKLVRGEAGYVEVGAYDEYQLFPEEEYATVDTSGNFNMGLWYTIRHKTLSQDGTVHDEYLSAIPSGWTCQVLADDIGGYNTVYDADYASQHQGVEGTHMRYSSSWMFYPNNPNMVINYDGNGFVFYQGDAHHANTELQWTPAEPADPSMVGNNYTGTNYNIGGNSKAKINWRDRTLNGWLWDFNNNQYWSDGTHSQYWYKTSRLPSVFHAELRDASGNLLDSRHINLTVKPVTVFEVTEKETNIIYQYIDTSIDGFHDQMAQFHLDVSSLWTKFTDVSTYVDEISGRFGEYTKNSSFVQTADSIRMSVWNISTYLDSSFLTSDEIHSEFNMTASNIELAVYDELKRKTGIDVSAGHISLDAAYTDITGQLNLYDASSGFVLYNDNEPCIVISNSSIYDSSVWSFTKYATADQVPGSIYSDGQYHWYTCTYFTNALMIKAGSSVKIDNTETIVFSDNIGDVSIAGMGVYLSPSRDSVKAVGIVPSGSSYTQTSSRFSRNYSTFAVSVTDSQFTGSSGETISNASTNDIFVYFGVTVYYRGTSAFLPADQEIGHETIIRLTAVSNSNNVTKIGSDGLICRTSNSDFLYIKDDKYQIRHGDAEILLKNGAVQRTYQGWTGDIQSVCPVRTLDITYIGVSYNDPNAALRPNMHLLDSDCFVVFTGSYSGANPYFYLDAPASFNIGKKFYIKNISNKSITLWTNDTDNNYFLAPNSKSPQNDYDVGGYAMMVISTGSYWALFYCG